MSVQVKRLELSLGSARWILTAASFVIACAVVALHVPGHVSMDTSIQLHEAHTGLSESWNPPFMSALMQWFGGGELATTAIVLMQVLLLYGGTLLAVDVLLRERARIGQKTLPIWSVLIGLLVIGNPVVALYAGIVWKDVLFASLLLASCSLALVATTNRGLLRLTSTTVAVCLLAAALLARQQGVFMAPVLLLMLLVREGWIRPLWRWVFVAVGFVAVVFLLQHRVVETIRESNSKATSIGFRSIMIFDMMGILAGTQKSAEAYDVSITQAQLEAMRRVYQPSRIDYISNDPVAESWVVSINPTDLKSTWWTLIKQEPMAWIQHRTTAYATLLGLRGIEPTQPVHMGMDGNVVYLNKVGLKERRGPRDLLIWRLANGMFSWPIWRHAFWLLTLIFCLFVWWRAKLDAPLYRSAGCIIFAVTLFYASFVPTMISSDFRYLFGAIPLVGILLMLLALAPRRVEGAS